MKTIWTWLQSAFVAVGGFVGWYLGTFDGFLYALATFIVVDYVTGVLKAISQKNLSSDIGARGIVKKVAIFLVVGIGNIADTYLLGNSGAILRTAVIFFYISNEGISLLENIVAIGVPVPEKLKDALAQLHEKSKGNGGNQNDDQ